MKQNIKKVLSWLLTIVMVLSVVPAIEAKAGEDGATLVFSSDDVEKATIYYLVGEGGEEQFTEIKNFSPDGGDKIRVNNVENNAKVTIKVVAKGEIIINNIRMLEGSDDNASSAVDGRSENGNDGANTYILYTFTTRQEVDEYSLKIEYGDNNPGGDLGPEGPQGPTSWDQEYVGFVTGGLNLVSRWIGNSEGDISYEFSNDIDGSWSDKKTISKTQMEGWLNDIPSGKENLFGIPFTGNYIRILAGKDLGGDMLGFDIYSKNAEGEGYHRDDVKSNALEYLDYETGKWISFGDQNYRYKWEDYLKGRGSYDPGTGINVGEGLGLVIDISGIKSSTDALYCHIPFDSRKNLAWWNAKYKGEVAAAGDHISDDNWVENGMVELVRVASENGSTVYYSNEPNWVADSRLDQDLVVDIGKAGYTFEGLLREGYEGPRGQYTTEQMLEAANNASGQCNVPNGSIVTVKLTPDAGYQILTAQINGMDLTPDEGIPSQFSFKINNNIHFRALFEKTNDVVDASGSNTVSTATVNGVSDIIDTGNVALTVKDDNNYNTSNALQQVEGTAVASVDVSLDQIIAKAGKLSDAEQNAARAGTLEVSADKYWTNQLSELQKDISISMTVNGISANDANTISLVRDHNGRCEEIPVTITTQNGRVVASFNSDKFSTYTFVKKKSSDQDASIKNGTSFKDKSSGVTVKVIDSKKKEVSFTAPKSKSAKTVKVPNTVKINGKTFKVTKVEDKVFKGNKKVEKVTLPKNIKTIGKDAFNGAKNLKTVSISSNLTAIGNNAFKNCAKLTKISLPSKTTKIGSNAFSGCKKLKTITIKSTKLTKKTISKNAFKGLTKATTIKVPKSKVSAYKKLFKSKGLSSKVKVKKY